MGSAPSSSDYDEEEEMSDDMDNYSSSDDSDLETDDSVSDSPHINVPTYFADSGVENIDIPTRTVDLKEMAALNVAIALWNHSNIPKTITNDNVWSFASFESVLYSSVSESTKGLKVPTSVRDQIDKYVPKMRKEIEKWAKYHHQQVFFNVKNDRSIYYHIYYIVWYCNGTINYKETARNLLKSPRLSEVEKYHLLCTYCLKDDIERMSRSLFSNNVIDLVDDSTFPLIFYWNCYFRKELVTMIKGESMDCYMVKHRFVDNWPAKEYFFDRLDSNEQVQVVIWLIDHIGMKYLKLLLMKLKESQRLQVYMGRSVKIMIVLLRIEAHYEDVLATWSEIRTLITEIEFLILFKRMLKISKNCHILNEVWTSVCDEFKRHVFACSDLFQILETALRLWVSDKDNDIFFTMMRDADVNIKANLSRRQYFLEVCENCISENKPKLVDRLLNSCFDDVQDFVLFKRHIINEDFFGDHCLKLITTNQLSALDNLFGSFFTNPEESVQFKRNIAKKENFITCCEKLMNEYNFAALKRLLNVCLPNVQELARFKEDFVKKNFFADYCTKLITYDAYGKLEEFFRICLLQPEDLMRFKQQLTSNDFFFQHCEELVTRNQLEKLDGLLNSLLPNAADVLKFKGDFALISKSIKTRCLNYYGIGNFRLIDSLLNGFMSSWPDLILEYKKNLISSSEGLVKSIQLFENNADVLDKISENNFIPEDFGTEIKRTMMFSFSLTPILQSWIRDGRVSHLKDRLNQFLTTEVDKRVLKRQVFADPSDFIRHFFFKKEVPLWQSLMLWRFENEAAVQEYKNTMPVDELFDDILKNCVFEVYNASSLKLCKCKSNSDFVPLNRFLKWYFETPNRVKEYKMKRIDSYMQIDTIQMLLKKADQKYLKKVMTWFFDSDTGEIVKFKMKNKGRKILKYLDAV